METIQKTKELKANKGEWSEFYAFVKILVDGKLFAADSNLHKNHTEFFDVLNIERNEKKNETMVYDISKNDSNVAILRNGVEIKIVEKKLLKEGVKKIFNEIKNASARSFVSETAQKTMTLLECDKIKASNRKKEDLDILIRDRIASTNKKLGFSIKSMMGGASTLLNSSLHTNFIFCTESERKMTDVILHQPRVRDKVNEIEYNYGNLSYRKIDSEMFETNLKMIDSNFSRLLAEILLAYYQGKGKTLNQLMDVLDQEKILTEKLKIDRVFAVYKIKEFLLAIALGMTPSKRWEGETRAQGGYIIVKEDGDVVCYNLYNRDQFKQYLYDTVYLDTPSTTKHKFGTLFEEEGLKCIKLNLQIRFKK